MARPLQQLGTCHLPPLQGPPAHTLLLVSMAGVCLAAWLQPCSLWALRCIPCPLGPGVKSSFDTGLLGSTAVPVNWGKSLSLQHLSSVTDRKGTVMGRLHVAIERSRRRAMRLSSSWHTVRNAENVLAAAVICATGTLVADQWPRRCPSPNPQTLL